MQIAYRQKKTFDGAVVRSFSELGWMQAGVSSIAYRLAHLTVHRALVLFGMSTLFYFV